MWPKSIPFSDIKKFIVDAAGASYLGGTAVKVADYAAHDAINRASRISSGKEATRDVFHHDKGSPTNDAIRMASGIDVGTTNQTIINGLRQLSSMKTNSNDDKNNKKKKKKRVKNSIKTSSM